MPTRSLPVRTLLLFFAGVGASVAVLGAISYRQTVAQLNEQVEKSATDLLRALDVLVAQQPALVENGGLQPIVHSLALSTPGIRRISVFDPSLRVIADSDPAKVGRVSDQSGLTPLLVAGGHQHTFVESRGERRLRLALTLRGRWNPERRTDITGVASIEVGLALLDARLREAAQFYVLLALAIASMLSLAMYLIARHSLVRPIQAMLAVTRQMQRGDLSGRVDVTSANELGQLAAGLNAALEARRAAEDALAETTRHAEAASSAKSDFLASMSHELRTPFNAVIGFTSLLLDTPLTRQQREYVENVRLSAENLLTVINDILDFSKIEAGRIDFELAPFDLERLAQEVAQAVSHLAAAKPVEVALRIVPGAPGWVRGDAVRVRQVLMNLASNAVKFTDRGHVLIGVEGRRENGHCHVRMSVSDTGIGIPADRLSVIFDRFSQADSSTTRRFGGTGLGLAISRQLTQLMGGRLEVTSEVGVGSTFVAELTLPCEEPPVAAAQPVDVANMRVLVVDDLPLNARITEEMLRSWRMDVTVVASGSAALAALRSARSSGRAFRLAILDHSMPEMDGIETCRAIRGDPMIADTVLVLLSSLGTLPTPKDEALFDGWLLRPARPSELLETISKALLPDSAVLPGPPPQAPVAVNARVLLTEDNQLNQRVGVAMLTRLGCRVDVAANGLEAVDMTSRFPYDLVLMDCQMPEMDGFEATRHIRAREGTLRHTPIVALTAHAMTGDREHCLAAGMDDYLSKPTRSEDLAGVLRKYVVAAGGPRAPHPNPPIIVADREFLRQLHGLLRELAPADLTRIHEAIAQGDAEALRRAAHRLKGSVGHFGARGGLVDGVLDGAQDAWDSAAALEALARDEGTTRGAALLEARLGEAVRRLLAELDHLLSHHPS